MILFIDTREQRPLEFISGEVFEAIINKSLPYGDYAASLGIDEPIFPLVFERKSIGDLFGTMTTGYERFKEELRRAEADKTQLVLIIEGSLFDILKGFKHSKFEGLSMVKKLFMLWCRYNIIPVFCNDRDEMVCYIEQAFDAINRNYKKK